MALPKIVAPEFTTIIPSTKQEIRFRPYLVKEEKVLFMAQVSGETKDMASAIATILDQCILTEDVDVSTFASFDIEYMFLQIRARSVGEVIKLELKHSEFEPGANTVCNYVHEHEIYIDDVKVETGDDHTNILKLTDSIGIEMRYPTALDMIQYDSIEEAENHTDMFDYAGAHIVQVFDGEETYDSFTEEELNAFMESLSTKQFGKIIHFFESMPKLRHSFEWICPQCKEVEYIHLEGLNSFFT